MTPAPSGASQLKACGERSRILLLDPKFGANLDAEELGRRALEEAGIRAPDEKREALALNPSESRLSASCE